MKAINFLVKKIGWGGIAIIIVGSIIYVYALVKKHNIIANSEYVKGISLGIKEGVRGSMYLHYSFEVNEETYNGNVTSDFCKKCPKCSVRGDTVIVRYEEDNPQNNDLVFKLPNGKNFQ